MQQQSRAGLGLQSVRSGIICVGRVVKKMEVKPSPWEKLVSNLILVGKPSSK